MDRCRAEGRQKLLDVLRNKGHVTQGRQQPQKQRTSRGRTSYFSAIPRTSDELCQGQELWRKGKGSCCHHITSTALTLFYAVVVCISLWEEYLSSISVVLRSSGGRGGGRLTWQHSLKFTTCRHFK